MANVDIGSNLWRTIVVVVAPVVLLAVFVAHPYLSGRLPNDAGVAAAVAAGTMRWGAVHLATSVASGLLILAFLAVRSYLRESGRIASAPSESRSLSSAARCSHCCRVWSSPLSRQQRQEPQRRRSRPRSKRSRPGSCQSW
jgi:hypothetical protein